MPTTPPRSMLNADHEMDTTITVVVTAEDGTTMMTYTITVDRAMPDDPFDANGDGMIDASELSSAIASYAAGDITASELSELINRYATGS